jgi:hypothetical protein
MLVRVLSGSRWRPCGYSSSWGSRRQYGLDPLLKNSPRLILLLLSMTYWHLSIVAIRLTAIFLR